MRLRQEIVAKARRLVVKVGTGVVTGKHNRPTAEQLAPLAQQIATLCRQGRRVALVSSGAIAAGMATLGLTQRPRQLSELQACAAIGQGKLMATYDEVFAPTGLHVAQVLLTHEDLQNRTRHLNARNTLMHLLVRGVVPIINENDTVAVEEIKFGDNDRLGALTATLIDADLLVILSHIPGLLDRDGRVVPVVPVINREVEALAGGTDRTTSVGGMKSKIAAAKIVTRAGIPMVIADGERPDVLPAIVAGEDIGTLFLPQSGKLASRKRWIAFFQKPTARLIVDEGARRALCERGKSLLAGGVMSTEGQLVTGQVVSICGPDGAEFARGLLKATSGVMVHRDDLVIL